MRSIIRLAAALALGIATPVAIADVNIVNLSNINYFTGQLGAAATPSQLNAYVQCQLYGPTLYCSASDDRGNYANCVTSDANVKQMFPMMDKSSLLQVFYDNAGNCTKIAVVNMTRNLRLSSPAGSFNYSVPTVVDKAGRIAYGTIGARPAVPDNHNEGISCTAQSFGQISCVASDSAGTFISCYSFGSSPLQTIADQTLAITAINEFSYVYFTWDDTSAPATCTSVSVLNASYFAPR